jgi:hypothetical protein
MRPIALVNDLLIRCAEIRIILHNQCECYDIPLHEVIHTLVPEAPGPADRQLSATLHRRSVINTPGSTYREDPW